MRNIEEIKRLEAIIGNRETTAINSSNRTVVKKWLRELGIPSKKTEKMVMETLKKSYRHTAYLNAVLESHGLPAYPESGETVQPATQPVTQPVTIDQQPEVEAKQPMMTQQQQQQVNPDVAAQIAALLGSLSTPSVDVDEIKKLVREEVAKQALAPQVIKVTLKDRTIESPVGFHHEATEEVIKLLGLGMNVFLKGPAGSGKTTTAMKVAESLGLKFHFTGSVPSEHKLLGWMDANGKTLRTPFREAFEHGGLFLFDEVDASNPNALLAMNAALDNGICAFPDATIKKHEDFVVICAANTWGNGADAEYCGRNRLDGASLQRFVSRDFDYDEKLERQIAGNDTWVAFVQGCREAKLAEGIRTIISPRQSLRGATLLDNDFTWDRVADLLIAPELDAPTREKLIKAGRVNAKKKLALMTGEIKAA